MGVEIRESGLCSGWLSERAAALLAARRPEAAMTAPSPLPQNATKMPITDAGSRLRLRLPAPAFGQAFGLGASFSAPCLVRGAARRPQFGLPARYCSLLTSSEILSYSMTDDTNAWVHGY